MTEQELRELDIKVAKLLGWKVVTDGKYPFQLLAPENEHRGYYACEDHAWTGVPRFTRSLDACALLIEEIKNAGWRVSFLLGCGVGDECVEIYDDNDYDRTHKIYWLGNSIPQLQECAIGVCTLFCSFNELTTEVSTTKGEENHG